MRRLSAMPMLSPASVSAGDTQGVTGFSIYAQPAMSVNKPPADRTPSARTQAVAVLCAVLGQRRSLARLLPPALAPISDAREKGLVQELVYGVMRWHPRLEAILGQLVERPIRAKDLELRVQLLTGLYQVFHTRIPAHAIVSETVEQVRRTGRSWAAGFANGVLRAALRDRDRLQQQADRESWVRGAHPEWLFRALSRDWPGQAEAIIAANNARAPMCLRVNLQRTTLADYCALLRRQGLEYRLVTSQPAGVVLADAVEAACLPGYSDGLVSIQDNAAQRAAPLLDLHESMQVLDVCAAPGGKSAHLLELCPRIDRLVMIDSSAARMETLRQNLVRLGLTDGHCRLEFQVMDALHSQDRFNEAVFDRILLDVPCSATGVIRRHPDIKFLRRQADIAELAAVQQALLEQVWPLLRPGGRLLYTTCSVLRRENSAQIEAFLARHADAQCVGPDVQWGLAQPAGRQCLPGLQSAYGLQAEADEQLDGFYYACLQRRI